MSRINRSEYKEARRLLRDNGDYAYRWIAQEHGHPIVEELRALADSSDPLAERASIIAYCKRAGIECNVRHTQPTRH